RGRVCCVVGGFPRADGSVGWCTMIPTGFSSFVGWLDADGGRPGAGGPANMRIAGSIRPLGRARRIEGGYRLEGRWDFASGVNHANWLLSPCVVWEGDKPLH